MSTEGSCACGDIKISYEGEPAGSALCHCTDCRKITGSAFSSNYVIPDDKFKLESGKPHEWAKTADSGNTMTSFLCSNCGSTMWRSSTKAPGVKFVKVGVLEGDKLVKQKWDNELYVPRRVPWVPEQKGATQIEGMM
ncbi:DUF636 domain protein [Microthyrium microscopicum]|uniref:DUF636 domain protein n=1 Tax=Microthyrium microscopicum TaxID=703497 RepID=A0A6A6URG7_9PEZI|nr:DUF636 domain protein [Microthyrium microscopicum]